MTDPRGLPPALAKVLAEGAPDAPWLNDDVAAELEHTRARTSAILQMAPDAMLGLDGEGRVTLVNEAALDLFRSEIRGLLGRHLSELVDGVWSAQVVRAQQAGGEARVVIGGVEVTARRSDGTTLPVEVSLARTPIDTDLVSTAFLRDVSERVAARLRMAGLVDELRVASHQAEEASRAKSEFLSRMSHELRTPLNAILGFAQLLEMEAADDLDRESIAHIGSAGRHLLALVEDVLDISRIEAGGLRLDPEVIDPSVAVVAAVDLLATRATEAGVVIEVRHPADAIRVLADERRLVQIIANLVSNAVKYGGGGSVVVDGGMATDRWRITVADEGPGIADGHLERAFEPFERLGADSTAVEGTGVGLALSRQLAHAMGGELRLRSVLGQGTVAEVELPLV